LKVALRVPDDAPAFTGRFSDAGEFALGRLEGLVGDGGDALNEFCPGQAIDQPGSLDCQLAAAIHLAAGSTRPSGGGAQGVLDRPEEAFDVVGRAGNLGMIIGMEEARPVAVGYLDYVVDEVARGRPATPSRGFAFQTVQVASQDALDLGSRGVALENVRDVPDYAEVALGAIGDSPAQVQRLEGSPDLTDQRPAVL